MPRTRFLAALAAPLILAVLLLAAAPLHAAKPVVELYITSWCPYCAKAKAYFDAKGIAYSVYDIDKDAAAEMRFKRYGGRGVPLVMINGTAISGYDVAGFEKALAAPAPAPTGAAAHSKIVAP